jgi:hypothetical protein
LVASTLLAKTKPISRDCLSAQRFVAGSQTKNLILCTFLEKTKPISRDSRISQTVVPVLNSSDLSWRNEANLIHSHQQSAFRQNKAKACPPKADRALRAPLLITDCGEKRSQFCLWHSALSKQVSAKTKPFPRADG